MSFYWEKESNASLRDQLNREKTSTQQLNQQQQQPIIIGVNKNN